MNPDKQSSLPRFPTGLLVAALVLTAASVIWLTWNAYDSNRFVEELKHRHIRCVQLQGVIIHLDEVLTMSARMAAATGDLNWEKRYRHYEPELDAAIKEAAQLAPQPALVQMAAQTDVANLKLVDMENRAFDLVHHGQLEQARAVLFSPAYEKQKQIYAAGITHLLEELNQQLNTKLHSKETEVRLSILSTGVVLAALLVVWFTAMRTLTCWRTAFRCANDSLETRVQERTAQLTVEIADRGCTEEQLRLQSTALEAAANAIVITDCDGTIRWVNPAFTLLTGYTREEVIGNSPRVLKSGKHDAAFYAELWRTVKAGNVWHGELINRRKDGSEYPEEMTITPVRDASGQVAHFIAIKQEVTDRRRAEEALRELQRQQRALLDNIPDIAWVKDKEGRYVAVNEALSKAYGHKPKEIVGKTDFEMVPPELAERYRADDRHVMESCQRKRVEEPFEDATGKRTWIDTIKSPIIDDKGEVIGTAGIARDFTARKNMEEALRASEERYRSLFETMREGFALCEIICDAAGTPCDFRYLEVNAAFEEIIGIKRSQTVNKTVREIFPQIEDYWIDTYGKVALTGAPAHFENYLGALNKHIAVAAFSPKPGQFAAIFMDITKRKKTESTLQETNRRLENALEELKAAEQQVIQQERLRALGTMASGIAHDFNNALASILGFSELLLYRPANLDDKAKTRRYLELINTAAKDGGTVVNRLREFYRHRDEGDVFGAVNLNHLAQQAVSLTQPRWKNQAEAKGVSIAVTTDPADVPLIAGNESELREALANLILNSVDAMPEGGTITLRTRHEDAHVIIEVADTGTGMTEEVRRRCLEPFFSTKGERGTGLGLSMVYGIVQRHEGTVDIQTVVGKGTTFILRFPAKAKAKPESAAPTDAALRPQRILFVDDEEPVRHIVAEFLGGDGHKVTTAGSGREGLEKFRANQPEIVIVDRAMPGMSGDQLAVAIKGIAPHIPVIMLTGFGAMMEAAGEKPPSVDFIISKPVTIAGLRAAMTKTGATS